MGIAVSSSPTVSGFEKVKEVPINSPNFVVFKYSVTEAALLLDNAILYVGFAGADAALLNVILIVPVFSLKILNASSTNLVLM